MSDQAQTIDDVRDVLIKAIASEAGYAPAELPTDRPFTEFGLDSMAALSVGMEIEETCGLSDLPVTLLWDHPTVDALTEALWALMQGELTATAAEGQ
ncbi:acyl carrier protein [Streptomyces hoynatensis]|uniref:Acyl carrier protein n=1 Tax=Streptomyces hoynatensis TaxID=1141874 RepID=A0A3A9YYQ7_9ACTN|nr:acyl carrier protein [Streptomyces hoynatensis]RKN40377.1 acyl carrier protein [Streptomyces hoynatensis]